MVIEQVREFATVVDSTGRTGLQRLQDDVFLIRDESGRRYYRAIATMQVDSTAWGDAPSRDRFPARPERAGWASRARGGPVPWGVPART